MTQTNPWLLTIIVLFTLCSCAVITQTEIRNPEDEALANHISMAKALEDSKEYCQAAKAYGLIAETFPVSWFHTRAVRKAAFLSVHPESAQVDFNASLHWFNLLLSLPISPAEEESVQLHIACIEQIKNLEDQVAELDNHNKKLVSDVQEQAKQLAEKDKEYQLVKSELARIKQEFRKMKEVDILLHKSRTTE